MVLNGEDSGMTHRVVPFACVATFIVLYCLSPAWGQHDNETPSEFPGVWYRILIDGNGNYMEGQGDGRGWYYYPDSGVYRMWFYNGPYDATRKGYLNYHVYTKAVDPTRPTSVIARFGWTTAEWSNRKLGYPPGPDDMPTVNDEAKYMSVARVYSVEGVVTGSAESIREHTVEEYNPEWVCIEFEARNAYIYRGAFHECQPKGSQIGACCNRQTGYCYLTTKSDCTAPLDWLGAGTTCGQCTTTSSGGTDYGDAPNENYRTLLASNGARHTIVPGVYLGSSVDRESDGQPNAIATGDDAAGTDDEDGVAFASTLQVGRDATVNVTASRSGYLSAWIDFDGDGRFSEREEAIFTDQPLFGGLNPLSFPIPAKAVPGWTYARFRFSTRGLLSSYGPADDGEVEDYRVQIVQGHDPKIVSGASELIWSQRPTPVTEAQPYVFPAGGAVSALHLHQIAADDWQPVPGRPLTGVHWWGTFEGWFESSLPTDMPVAFHLGVWTNVPDSQPYNFETFPHPGALIWETYCTNWTWTVAGSETPEVPTGKGRTCFLFSHTLSQDRWFEVGPAGEAKDGSDSRVYWLSISALYDPTKTPAHLWNWKTRSTVSNAGGTSLLRIVPLSKDSTWPPVLGSQWQSGTTMRDRWVNPIDMAFQLTTFAPLETDERTSTTPNADGATDHGDLAMLAATWLDLVR
jgi:hypothetical protein